MTFTAPHPGEPEERNLAEAETLKALDLLHAMRRRLDMMDALMAHPGDAGALHSFEKRLLEHASLAEDLQAVIWAAWGEDDVEPGAILEGDLGKEVT